MLLDAQENGLADLSHRTYLVQAIAGHQHLAGTLSHYTKSVTPSSRLRESPVLLK